MPLRVAVVGQPRCPWPNIFARTELAIASHIIGRERDQLNQTSEQIDSIEGLVDRHGQSIDAVWLDDSSDWMAEVSEVLDAGKHLLLNGARCPLDVLHAIGTMERSNLRVQVDLPWRAMPSVRSVRRSLDQGVVGRPGLVRIHHWQSRTNDEAIAALPALDLVCWLFGSTPSHIHAAPVDRITHGTIWHLGYADGGMAIVSSRADLAVSNERYFSLHLIGSDGAIYIDDHHNMQVVYSDRLQCDRTREEEEGRRWSLDQFARGVECGAFGANGLAAACQAQALANEVAEGCRDQTEMVLSRRATPYE